MVDIGGQRPPRRFGIRSVNQGCAPLIFALIFVFDESPSFLLNSGIRIGGNEFPPVLLPVSRSRVQTPIPGLKTRLAITGGVACGKTTVGAMLRRRGIPVCDADEVAHRSMEPGTGVYRAVVREFGSGVLDGEGRIERSRLGAIVFADEAARLRLNAMVHPAVLAYLRDWVKEQEEENGWVAAIVPLLYEIGAEAEWDIVLCVTTTVNIQRRRLADRGFSGDAADRRIAAQMSVAEKARRADIVIMNRGTMDLLEAQIEWTLRHLRSNRT
jgi:dephospho-CoA kinase